MFLSACMTRTLTKGFIVLAVVLAITMAAVIGLIAYIAHEQSQSRNILYKAYIITLIIIVK